MTSEAIVVGCGISGLTCGIALLEAGVPVTIVARDLPPHTTSDVAAAIWYPYRAFPERRVLEWGRVTLDTLYDLMTDPAAGVRRVTMTELFERATPDPWWKDAVRIFGRATGAELPPGYVDGYRVEVPLIETPVHMRYLMHRFRSLGGRLEQRSVRSLAELYRDGRVIVTCAGVWAGELAADDSVFPIRGQALRVRAPGIERGLVEQSGALALSYVVPRTSDCILGGTADEHDWSLAADPDTSAQILRRCNRLVPALAGAEVIEAVVGLRPGRREVRLERESVSQDCAVIHNYGHGGAGFTLAWGCAREVVELARERR